MKNINALYLNYMDSEEYRKILKTKIISEETKECEKLLNEVLNNSDLTKADKEDIIMNIEGINEFIGFCCGFKCAMELMKELKLGDEE